MLYPADELSGLVGRARDAVRCDTKLLSDVVALARRAGDAILGVYGQQFEVTSKADQSPLTLADMRSHEIIVHGLAGADAAICRCCPRKRATFPSSERRQWQRYWLVDPLDGTKEFVSRNGEFTVNIALIEGHDARARRRARAGDWHDVHGRARRRRVRGRPAASAGADSGVERRRRHRCASSAAARIAATRSISYLPRLEPYRAGRRRQLDQVLPGRRRQRGFLSALRPDQRMGHGRRASRRRSRRRTRDPDGRRSGCVTTPRPSC